MCVWPNRNKSIINFAKLRKKNKKLPKITKKGRNPLFGLRPLSEGAVTYFPTFAVSSAW